MKTSENRFRDRCHFQIQQEPQGAASFMNLCIPVFSSLLALLSLTATSLIQPVQADTMSLSLHSDGILGPSGTLSWPVSGRVGRGGDGIGAEANAYYIYQLPNNQPSYRVFTNATFSFEYIETRTPLTDSFGNPFLVDLWGAVITPSPTVSSGYFHNSDSYSGPGSGTKIHNNILNWGTSLGRISTSVPALFSYLQSSIGTGDYVTLRLNQDRLVDVNIRGYEVAFQEHSSADPTLNLTYYDPEAVITNPNFGDVLVGSSKNASLRIRNSGNSVTQLIGSPPTTSTSGDFTRVTSGTFNLSGGFSRLYTYSFEPDSRGNSSETRGFNTNIGAQSATFAGTGVAPVSSLNQANNDAGYVLVGNTGTASITIQNVGDGNDSGEGAVSNLTGTVSNGSGGFSLSGGNNVSLTDSSSQTFNYNYSPSARGSVSQSLTASFTNGSQNNQNQAHTLNYTLEAQGVAPVYEQTSTTGAGPTRVGTTGTATVRISNNGDGNLSGLPGTMSNLNGDSLTASGLFSASATSISLGDGAFQDLSFDYTPTARSASDSQVVNFSFSNGSANGQNNSFTDTATLTGSAVGPVFESSRPVGGTYDLGTPGLSAVTDTISFSLFNNTTDTGADSLVGLTLLDAEFTGPDAANFSLQGFTPGTVLSPTDGLMLDVIFANDQVIGQKFATLTFTTDQNAAFGAAGDTFSFNFTASVPVPEPASGWLLLMGLFFLKFRRSVSRV